MTIGHDDKGVMPEDPADMRYRVRGQVDMTDMMRPRSIDTELSSAKSGGDTLSMWYGQRAVKRYYIDQAKPPGTKKWR